jgi:hypothetical protein
MEFTWQAAVKVPDGIHSGEIARIEYRTEPYEYTDFVIKLDDVKDAEMKYGTPSVLTTNSKLGRMLQALGIIPEVGVKIDPEKLVIGKKVTLMTITKKSKKDASKEYSEIVEDSVKLKL